MRREAHETHEIHGLPSKKMALITSYHAIINALSIEWLYGPSIRSASDRGAAFLQSGREPLDFRIQNSNPKLKSPRAADLLARARQTDQRRRGHQADLHGAGQRRVVG